MISAKRPITIRRFGFIHLPRGGSNGDRPLFFSASGPCSGNLSAFRLLERFRNIIAVRDNPLCSFILN